MFCNALGLVHAELRNARHRGLRNGRWNKLKDVDRGLFESAIEFTKRGNRIVSAQVISRLCIVMKKLEIINSIIVRINGEIKAVEMRTQYRARGVFKWVPRLKAWLNDTAYKFWLGTMEINLEEFHLTACGGPS